MSDLDDYPDLFKGVREQVLTVLPPNAVRLHEQIEKYANLPIGFRTASRLQEIDYPGEIFTSAYCDENHAYITIDDTGSINPEAVTHELLHIQRYWMERAPMIEAKLDIGPNVEFMTWLDNALEHLIIVPRERRYGSNPTPHWSAIINDIFSEQNSDTDQDILRPAYIMGWTITSYCNDPAARKEALAGLQRLGVQRVSRLLLQNLLKARGSKPRMARIALKALGIPPTQAQLATIEIRERKRVLAKIPEQQ